MYYVVHLLAPVLVALIAVIEGNIGSNVGRDIFDAIERLMYSYVLFAAPHWIWAALSCYFEANNRTSVGGFFGAHLLLVAMGIFVLGSNASEALNGWLLYLIGSPFGILAGATVGAKFSCQRNEHVS